MVWPYLTLMISLTSGAPLTESYHAEPRMDSRKALPPSGFHFADPLYTKADH